MKASSRVIIRAFSNLSDQILCNDIDIEDIILHDPIRTDEDLHIDLAPYPLLPNYGVARVKKYYVDMIMMNLQNSKERTFSELVELW